MINTMITAHISPCRSGLLAAIRAGDGAPTPVDRSVGAASRRELRPGTVLLQASTEYPARHEH